MVIVAGHITVEPAHRDSMSVAEYGATEITTGR